MSGHKGQWFFVTRLFENMKEILTHLLLINTFKYVTYEIRTLWFADCHLENGRNSSLNLKLIISVLFKLK